MPLFNTRHTLLTILLLAFTALAVASPIKLSEKSDLALGDTIVHQPLPGTDGFSFDIFTFRKDSIATLSLDSLDFSISNKKIRKSKGAKATTDNFVPDPKKALWLALVCPGAGQIYNRKYWKLPIIYGGFLGCTYALLWNQQMYRDYSQAYLDIMDDDPATASYKNMLPMGYDITGREEQFKKIFRHKRDYYRKYRDMSIFAFFAVYGLSIVDAYVDAQLSTFDISKDLSLSVVPATITQEHYIGTGHKRAVGVQCSLTF